MPFTGSQSVCPLLTDRLSQISIMVATLSVSCRRCNPRSSSCQLICHLFPFADTNPKASCETVSYNTPSFSGGGTSCSSKNKFQLTQPQFSYAVVHSLEAVCSNMQRPEKALSFFSFASLYWNLLHSPPTSSQRRRKTRLVGEENGPL